MAQNSKDVLFKSKVNSYISEKLSQSTTPPTFSVTDDGNEKYTLSNFNGNVSLTIEGGNYLFTPSRGSAVSIAISSVTTIVVDFITLNADTFVLNGLNITGSGVVNLHSFTSMLDIYLSGIQPAVVSATVMGDLQTPIILETFEIANPTVGRIINIIEGEVTLNSSLSIPTNTSIVVDTEATLTLTQVQNANGTVSGQGTINVVGSPFTFVDTGKSDSDGITSNSTINVILAENTLSWQYTLDGGTTWIDGSGNSFELPEGTYDKQNIQVKQFDEANFTGNASISPMSTLATPSMVQLEAIGVTNAIDRNPQITSVGTAGEYAVTFEGIDSDGDYSIFVQKFNADGTIAGSMVKLEAIGKTNGIDGNPQITSIGTAGEYVVTFNGQDTDGDNSVFVQKFNADGTIAGEMVQLEAIGVTNAADWFSQITSIGVAGEYVVTFYGIDSDGDDSVFVQKFNANGTIAGDMVKLEAIGVANDWDRYPQITSIGTAGEYVVVFEGKEFDQSVFVQKFNADGTTTGDMVKLEAIGVTNAPDWYPQITSIGAAGEYAVTFTGRDSDGGWSIFVQKFNADGTTTGNVMVQLKAKDVTSTNNIISFSQITSIGTSGEFAVTFYGEDSNGDRSIFVQKFNADGTTDNAIVKLEAIGMTDSVRSDTQITSIGTAGEYVVTFSGIDSEGDYSIFVQKFNADGTTTDSDMVKLEAIGVTDGWDINPKITSIGTAGEYVVTFQGIDSEGDYSIFVQKFNADGTLKVDTTLPTIASTNPIIIVDTNNDSTGVYAAQDKILISFSEPIDASALTLADILLSNSHTFGEGAVLSPSSGFAATLEITLGTDPTIASGDTLTVEASKLVDKAGNANAAEIVYSVPIITDKIPPAIIDPADFIFSDTGASSTDGITSSGTITIALAGDALSWQYTLNGGTTWNDGTGSSFEIPEGSYDKQNIQVKQFDGANFTGNESISPMSTLTTPSMVKLEAIGVVDGNNDNYESQITSIGTAGEYVVTFAGEDSEGDSSIFVQKFNADGTTTGNAMVQLEAIGVTDGEDRKPQITSIGTAGEYVVTFYGIDSEGDYSIFVQKFNADGTVAGAMVKLEAIGIAIWDDINSQITSIGTAGEFVVTFEGDDVAAPMFGNYSAIFVQKFNADGTLAGDMVKLTAIEAANRNNVYPQITSIGTAGEYVVTFQGRDSDGNWTIFVQKFNADGTVAGGMIQLGAIGVSNGWEAVPQITSVGTAGEYAVTFQGGDSDGNWSIFVQKFNADGTTTDNAMVQLKPIPTESYFEPQITSVGTEGEFVVSFYGLGSNDDWSVFVQKFNANGTTAGDIVQLEVIVDGGYSYMPQINSIGTAGEFVVVFHGETNGNDSVFVQKFNADGTIAGNAVVQLEAIGLSGGYDGYPQITSIGTAGEFVVTFTGETSSGDDSIFVQKFNADGTIAAHPQNTLKVDTTPPTIALTNPITITDTKILISFSEPIDASALMLDDILLSNSHTFGEGAVLSPSSGFAATLEITLGTQPTIASGDTLTVEASKLVDKAGNANAAEIVYTLPTFEVINTGGAITFAGTATGMISLSVDSGTVTFTKGSIAAATTVELGSITGIVIDSGETIKGSAADLDGISITGAGNVVITGSDSVDNLLVSTSGTNSITAGLGGDTINLGTVAANGGDDTIIIAAGDSTTAAPDTINYFELDKDTLDLPSVIVASNSIIGTGVSGDDVTVGSITIGQKTITNGIATFQAANDATPVVIDTQDALSAAVAYLGGTVADAETVAFVYDMGSGDNGTYIFQGNASEDILVNLVGVATVDDLSAILV